MVLVTVAVAMFVASWGPPAAWLLLHTLLGTALVAASASALNQWLERAYRRRSWPAPPIVRCRPAG